VQWFSLVNSVLITIFLSAMVGMILMRSLHRDIMRYNQSEATVRREGKGGVEERVGERGTVEG
jgi:transmembrane 9 superfamily protein 2/4